MNNVFKIKLILLLFLIVSFLLILTCKCQDNKSEILTLEEGFRNPPMSVRPWAYWVWFNGNFNYSQMTKELEDIKSKGMGGFDIFDTGERFPEQGKIPAGSAFLGKESLEAIHYAMDEAKRLGLGIGLITSSSWNAGGSWVKPEYASKALFASDKIIVKGPVRFSKQLPFPSFPENAPRNADEFPVSYKDIAVIAYPSVEDSVIKDVLSIKDISSNMDKNGHLDWNVPEGEWVIVRFICTNTGKKLHMPSINSQGLIIDHFNPDATEKYFQTIIDKLQSEIGNLENSALKQLYLCSYENWGISWTYNFQQEFLKRRGYDMTPYLPVLLGLKIQDDEITGRFQHDFNRTMSDLLIDAHYKVANKITNQVGLQLCAESGGPGPVPVESLKALGAIDIPRGEFWRIPPAPDMVGQAYVKGIASAAHTYGKKIVDQEAFTGWEMWQEGPCDLKPLADNAFCNGMNKVTFHTYPHNPPEAGIPGWAFYAGTHIGSQRVWWPKVKPFMDYLSRVSYLLRQGLFKADVCYYYGDRGYNLVPEKHNDPSRGYGYDYDVVNAEVILTRMKVEKGEIMLPDGMNYQLLVLPDDDKIDLDVLKKIRELVYNGITVIGPKPTRTNSLTDYPDRDEEVREIAEELWGDCDGNRVKEHAFGKGKVIWGRNVREVLQEEGLTPDFNYNSNSDETDIDYIHRYTDDEDIYFVSNKKQSFENVICTFRVKEKTPALWFPETGGIRQCVVYKNVKEGISMPLSLSPGEAVFVVFKEKKKQNYIVSIRQNDDEIFPVNESTPVNARIFDIQLNETDKLDFIALKKGFYTFELANGKKTSVCIEDNYEELAITGPWDVHFPYGWGAPVSVTFPTLKSWTENPDKGIKSFSGIATYYKEFEMPADFDKTTKQLVLDLGGVKLLADVYLNGRHIGVLWKEPYLVDITNVVKPGKNNLVVEVANTWSNRLIGDGKLRENERRTKTNIEHVWGPLMQGKLWKDATLLESGLLGPVKIKMAQKEIVDLN